ncbi:MAG: TonB-dependent receptor [Planctomycetales bacterium]|nr:TonB-dependent receptor [Planctomycetales bacterium]
MRWDGTHKVHIAARIAVLTGCLCIFDGPRTILADETSSSATVSPATSGTRSDASSQEGDSAESPPSDGEAADVDDLLNLDIDQLSETPVKVDAGPLETTLTDPVVESVSKTPEKASEAPGIVDVITADEIESFGAKNLYELLQRATSVFMTGSFMFGDNMASVRGNLLKHEDNHVLILLNGRPFRDSTAGGINWSLYSAFPIQTIERVEVLRGPGSVLYGTNAFTGVINIVTKKPNGRLAHSSALAGTHGWQSYQLSGGHGDGSDGLHVGATYLRQDGWPFAATTESGLTTGRYGENSVGVFGSYRKHGFSANAFVANATQASLGVAPIAPVIDSSDVRVFVDLGYQWKIDDDQTLQWNFTYNRSEFDTTSLFQTPYEMVSNGYLVEATYRARLTDRMDLMFGGLADTHQGRDRIVWPGAPPVQINLISPYSETWYGVYFQLDYRPVEWLKLVGGMQGNIPGEIKGGIVPRFGAIVSLTDDLTCKFLYGQAFRSPYQVERSIVAAPVLVGNPNLSPETIQTFDLHVAYAVERFRLAATAFHSDFFDVVTRIGTTPQSFVNQGGIKYQGLELENNWKLNDRWTWVGSTTYQENVRDGVHDTTYVPNWMAKMGLAYDNPQTGFRAGLFDTFFGKQNVPPTAASVNPDPTAYHLASLNSTLDLNRFLGRRSATSTRVQFLVQNLFNERIHHVEFEREVLNTLPAGPGRTYYGGVQVVY